VHFTLFILYCEEHTGTNDGWCGRGKRGANAGRVGQTNKNNRFADYKMQM
jgi:hypothetical protein